MAGDKFIRELTESTNPSESWLTIFDKGSAVAENKVSLSTLRKKIRYAEYDTTVAYIAGMLIVRAGVIYECINNTTGTFDPTKWIAVAMIGFRKTIVSGEIIWIPANSRVTTYGDVTINAGGQLTLMAGSELVIINGTLINNGTLNNSGTITQAVIADYIEWACSDETTALTTGLKSTDRARGAFTITGVRASVTTAPTGSTIIVDIKKNGTTIFSTKLTIDAGEKTSVTAATAAVLSTTTVADDDEITIHIDQVGSTIAGAGLKVVLIVYR